MWVECMGVKQGKNTAKILTMLLVFAMLLVAHESAQFVSTLEEHIRAAKNKSVTIVVDAGHGGIDPGKVGINKALEKDINLAIALKLERNLKESGVNVVMTRTDDSPSVCGVQVFYYKDSVKSKAAAEIMQTQLVKSLKPSKERAAKDNSSYYLLKKTSVPIMIVECAFMSNPTEADLLIKDDYQEKVAWAIYMGIMQVINSDSP